MPAGGPSQTFVGVGTSVRQRTITEVGVNFAYRFAPCTQLTFGYTLIYWNDILTAASAIDPTTGTAGGTTRPQFTFRHSDYWVQGLNLGLTRQF